MGGEENDECDDYMYKWLKLHNPFRDLFIMVVI